ncbi:MAG: TnpV protein [Clostridia bacterium]
MKISYSKKGDYYIPNLIPPRNMKGFQLGKYSALRLRYLKEHKKAKDQMEWVKRMNNISNIADEIVLNMYVYNNEN